MRAATRRPAQSTTLVVALTRWLPAAAWKSAHQTFFPTKAAHSWKLHPLVVVAVLMTWTTGDSQAERFATARAVYVARHPHDKRPGKTLAGFHAALARVPMPVFRALRAGVRRVLTATFDSFWPTDGFTLFACDGSRLECPRSAELEKQLGCAGKKGSAPTLYVTALVLLPLGLLWTWRIGPGTASEHEHLRHMLPALPKTALLVADAFYQGYELYRDIMANRASFLVRVSSRSHLYTDRKIGLDRFREGLVWFWPQQMRAQGRPPLRLRLIRVRTKKTTVWLLTDVRAERRLSRARAAQIYRWRWRIEGVFRTYKRTMPKVKLACRTEELVYREAELSLVALQVLSAQAARKKRQDGGVILVGDSPRQTLNRLRGEMTTSIGAELGPRQQRWYEDALAQARRGGTRKKVRRKWPRRKDHKAPKPPKIRVLPKALKVRMAKKFNINVDGKG
jgi:Transposase DDE domain